MRRWRKMEIKDKTIVTVFNKIDCLEQEVILKDLQSDYQVKISARTGEGLEELTEILETILRGRKIFLEKLYTYKDAGKIQTTRKFRPPALGGVPG